MRVQRSGVRKLVLEFPESVEIKEKLVGKVAFGLVANAPKLRNKITVVRSRRPFLICCCCAKAKAFPTELKLYAFRPIFLSE